MQLPVQRRRGCELSNAGHEPLCLHCATEKGLIRPFLRVPSTSPIPGPQSNGPMNAVSARVTGRGGGGRVEETAWTCGGGGMPRLPGKVAFRVRVGDARESCPSPCLGDLQAGPSAQPRLQTELRGCAGMREHGCRAEPHRGPGLHPNASDSTEGPDGTRTGTDTGRFIPEKGLPFTGGLGFLPGRLELPVCSQRKLRQSGFTRGAVRARKGLSAPRNRLVFPQDGAAPAARSGR